MSIYQRINGADWRNIYVVGDLHGCYSLLMSELEHTEFDPARDLLISVGDLIDRGAENVECLDLINQPWFRAVRGNHEQMMLDSLSPHGNVNHWIYNGGNWFFYLNYEQELLAKALLKKVTELPLIIELVSDNQTVVICHADYPHDEYAFGKPVDPEQVVWNRQRFNHSSRGLRSEIAGADLFIFGHTPAITPCEFSNQVYIDTGAVFTGNLTIRQVQGGAHE